MLSERLHVLFGPWHATMLSQRLFERFTDATMCPSGASSRIGQQVQTKEIIRALLAEDHKRKVTHIDSTPYAYLSTNSLPSLVSTNTFETALVAPHVAYIGGN